MGLLKNSETSFLTTLCSFFRFVRRTASGTAGAIFAASSASLPSAYTESYCKYEAYDNGGNQDYVTDSHSSSPPIWNTANAVNHATEH